MSLKVMTINSTARRLRASKPDSSRVFDCCHDSEGVYTTPLLRPLHTAHCTLADFFYNITGNFDTNDSRKAMPIRVASVASSSVRLNGCRF